MEGSEGMAIHDASDIHNRPSPVHQGKCCQPKTSGKSNHCDPEVGERHPVLDVAHAGGVRAGQVCNAGSGSSSYPPPNSWHYRPYQSPWTPPTSLGVLEKARGPPGVRIDKGRELCAEQSRLCESHPGERSSETGRSSNLLL